MLRGKWRGEGLLNVWCVRPHPETPADFGGLTSYLRYLKSPHLRASKWESTACEWLQPEKTFRTRLKRNVGAMHVKRAGVYPLDI